MPENNNNNFEELNLPKKNETTPENLEQQNEQDMLKIKVEENKQIIEIPQSYYDQKQAVIDAKAEAEKQEQMNKEISRKNAKEASKIIKLALINALIYVVLIITMRKINPLIIYLIPIYMIVSSIILAIKDKKETNQPISTLLGCFAASGIAFLISTKNEEILYYTFAFAICGIIGMITSNIMTFLITDKENVKALSKIGVFIYIITLFAIPFTLDYKFHEAYHKYVFGIQAEVKAETEQEFIEKTLKSRYNLTFTCDEKGKSIRNVVQKTPTDTRTCKSSDGTEIKVTSIAYKESEIQYIVQDNYIAVTKLNDYTTKLQTRIDSQTGGKTDIAFYPSEGCSFFGVCHDCDEYTENYKELNDINNQYKYSTELNLEKEINMDTTDFINSKKFKIIVELSGQFSSLQSSNYEELTTKVISELESSNLKNNYGFEIIIKDSTSYNKEVYKVVGKSSTDGSFKDYEIEEV